MDSSRIKRNKFLNQHIFKGLIKGIDDCSGSIIYFNEDDFALVLQRVEQYDIGIHGIEVMLGGEYYTVEVFEDYLTSANDPNWYTAAFEKLKNLKLNLRYSASYDVSNGD